MEMVESENKGLIDDLRSSSHILYTSTEAYEPLHQQWLFLIVAPNLFFYSERVPKIWYLVHNVRVNLRQNGMV